MRDTYLEFHEMEVEVDYIDVFTSSESSREINCDWHWSVYTNGVSNEGSFLKEDSGMMAFCGCSNCTGNREEICEFFALCQALEWIIENKSGFPVYSYVSSKIISLAKSEPKIFKLEVDDTQSCQLMQLGFGLGNLVHNLGVTIFEDCYENKDVVPVY